MRARGYEYAHVLLSLAAPRLRSPRHRRPRRHRRHRAGGRKQPVLDGAVLGHGPQLRLRPGPDVHARRPDRGRQGLPPGRRHAGLPVRARRLGAQVPDVRHARAEQRAQPATAGRLDPVPLLERAPPHVRLARLWRDRVGDLGDAPGRLAQDPAHRHRRRAWSGRGRGRLPRVLVAGRASGWCGRTSTGTSSPTAARANGTSGRPTSSTTGPARRTWRTSASCGPRTATSTRPSGGRPTAAGSSTRSRSEPRWTPSCSSAG